MHPSLLRMIADTPGDPLAGKDFDFAGSTARFLGHDRAPSATSTKPLEPPSTAWTDPLLSSAKPSPWTSLNDDPLLSSAGAGKTVYAQPPPAQLPTQQQGQQARQVKTLEEVEAEMRAAAMARQQQTSHPPAAAQGSARPMTLEEVEAEMLRRRGTAAAAPVAPPAQQQQQQELPPGLAPQAQTPLTSAPQLPFNPATFNPATFVPPAHLLPPNFTSLPPQIQQQIIAQHRAAAAAAVAAGTFRPPLPQPQAAQSQSPAFGRPPQGPGTPGPAFPPLGTTSPTPAAAAGGPNLMATLFPPLPSAPGAQGLPVSVEQGLQLLSLSQHTQHPSLTGAQLQALLHQAQSQSQAQGRGEGGEEEEQKKKAADELVRMVEKRIMEHEVAEARRKRKAAKIASMVRVARALCLFLPVLSHSRVWRIDSKGFLARRPSTTTSCRTRTRTSSRAFRSRSSSPTTLMPTISTSTSWPRSRRLASRRSLHRPAEPFQAVRRVLFRRKVRTRARTRTGTGAQLVVKTR